MYRSLGLINKALNGHLRSMMIGSGAELKLWKHNGDGEYNGSTHTDKPSGIDFYTKGTDPLRQINIFHEFGHLLDNVEGTWDVFMNAVSKEGKPSWVSNNNQGNPVINPDALKSLEIANDPNYTDIHPKARQTYYGFGPAEQWADAFANYVAGNINLTTDAGRDMDKFMRNTLAPYTGVP